jgi:hypothetical protein
MRFYLQLRWIARSRGYADGFAYHDYRQKFRGEKPSWAWKSMAPVEPDAAVLAWVRSRQIAYAKRTARAS